MTERRLQWTGLFILVALCGCGPSESSVTNAPSPPEATEETLTPVAPAQAVSDDPQAMSITQLRERLGIGDAGEIRKVGGRVVAMDLRGTGVRDLSALKGLPLQQLFVEETPVEDLTPLAGMPLEQLYLSHTKVTDLTPLEGMSLKELNLVGAPVADISPLRNVELGTLWLSETQVTDLGPLAGKQLVSLDVRATPVSDLTPLAENHALRRLHIAETQVVDVTPLADLPLERLIFTPSAITAGLDAVRSMSTLTGLDTHFEGGEVLAPQEFWQRYDAGDFQQK